MRQGNFKMEWKRRCEVYAEHGIVLPIDVETSYWNPLTRAWARFSMFMDNLAGVHKHD